MPSSPCDGDHLVVLGLLDDVALVPIVLCVDDVLLEGFKIQWEGVQSCPQFCEAGSCVERIKPLNRVGETFATGDEVVTILIAHSDDCDHAMRNVEGNIELTTLPLCQNAAEIPHPDLFGWRVSATSIGNRRGSFWRFSTMN